MRALLAGLVVACLATTASAREFEIEDMLSSESYGQVMFAPLGGRAVVERREPYDRGSRFSYGFMTRRMTSRVMMLDLRRPERLSPAFAQEHDAGYWAGGFSPGGTRLTVFRLQHDRLRLGVLDVAARRISWFPGAPDLPLGVPAPVWLDDHRMVYVRFSVERLPAILDGGRHLHETMAERWADAAGGAKAAADLASTTRQAVVPYERRELVMADVSAGTERTLTGGEISEFQISKDGRSAAIVELGPAIAPDVGQLVSFSTPSRRRRLRLLDMTSGRVWAPCEACDLRSGSLNFSGAGRLAFIARSDGEPWEAALARYTSGGMLKAAAETAAAEDLAWSGEDMLVRQAGRGWLGFDPTTARVWRLGDLNLVAGDGSAAWFSSRDELWRIGRGFGRTRLARFESVVDVSFLDANSTGSRRFGRPPAPILRERGISSDKLTFALRSRRPTTIEVPAGAELLAMSEAQRSAVSLVTDPHGVGRLYLYAPRSAPRLIDAISAKLAEVELPRAMPLRRTVTGTTMVDWLLLPSRGAGPFPMVVHPYQGTIYGDALPALARPDGLSPVFKPSILLANGYAVLLPSLPEGPGGHPQDTLMRDLDAAVDGALATGLIDPSRMAVHGHSYGGVNALTIAARSSRFRAIVSSSGLADLAGAYGSVPPTQKVTLADGPPFDTATAWYEAGQGGLDGPPWSVPERYRNASALFEADKVKTPLLLIAAELDYFPIEQAERLFVGLARLGKDATLLRLYGEGHIRQSPANIRLEWETVLAFLKDKMPLGSAAADRNRSGPVPHPALDARILEEGPIVRAQSYRLH